MALVLEFDPWSPQQIGVADTACRGGFLEGSVGRNNAYLRPLICLNRVIVSHRRFQKLQPGGGAQLTELLLCLKSAGTFKPAVNQDTQSQRSVRSEGRSMAALQLRRNDDWLNSQQHSRVF